MMEMNGATSGLEKNTKNLEFDIGNVCRVCLCQNVKMKQMFDADNDIIKRIDFCTGVQFTKEVSLPSKICDGCLVDLSTAVKFKRSCLLADETFQKSLSANIKKEPLEISVEYEDAPYVCNNETKFNIEIKNELKVELIDGVLENSVRKSSRLKLKDVVEKDRNEIKLEQSPKKTRKKRGPYKKTEYPKKMKKMKFRRLYCEPCKMSFKNREESDQHRKSTHSKDNWICEVCGKSFVHRASHYSHVKSHLPPQFGCEHCDYRTWHRHDLIKHLRIHAGIKLYQCEFCSLSYYTLSNLTSHIRRRHERLRRYRCELCAKSFYDRTKLNRHLDSHNNIKRFECEVCHACFTRRCYWKKHLSKQHGVIVPRLRPGRQSGNYLAGTLGAEAPVPAIPAAPVPAVPAASVPAEPAAPVIPAQPATLAAQA